MAAEERRSRHLPPFFCYLCWLLNWVNLAEHSAIATYSQDEISKLSH